MDPRKPERRKMPLYSYQAINDSGAKVSGTVEADAAATVTDMLVARGLIPSKVTEQKGLRLGSLLDRILPIKTPELILFTKQFRTMIKAGIPMMTLLQTLETQTDNPRLRKIITAMGQDISEGISLYDSFRKHPRVFSPLYCSMIRAGESSDALPQVMDRLIHILEHEHKIRSDIRSTLQYPIIVILFLSVAFFLLLTFVVPKFSQIFIKAGIELPLITRLCIYFYTFLTNYWVIVAVLVVGGLTALLAYFKTQDGKLFKDALLLKMPLLGALFQKAAMSRFASIFSILQASGVAVLDSMGILSETINNAAISKELEQLSEKLEEGQGIAVPLRQSRYFTPIVINMTAIGEETGNLEDMLTEIADHYDAELDFAMKRFSDSLGPILTVGLAVVVGFFALAIYLPMLEISTTVR